MMNTEQAMPMTHLIQPPLPDLPTAAANGPDLQHPDREVVLTVDKQGRIADCNQDAKELLGWEKTALEGHLVTDVIPELPFSPSTPGYNLAFAIFHAANGRWMRRMALMVDGKRIAVDMALSSVKTGYKRQIKLCLRLATPLLQAPARLAAAVQAPLVPLLLPQQ